MNRDLLPPPAFLGIERVVLVETTPVGEVDVMTRDPVHALILESLFGVHPFRFERKGETVHAFPRLPAARARVWLANQGVSFAACPGGLAPGGPVTWVQGSPVPAPRS